MKKIILSCVVCVLVSVGVTRIFFPKVIVEKIEEKVMVKVYPQIAAYCTKLGGEYKEGGSWYGECKLKGKIYRWDEDKGDWSRRIYLNE
jgi:hypothetical protein